MNFNISSKFNIEIVCNFSLNSTSSLKNVELNISNVAKNLFNILHNNGFKRSFQELKILQNLKIIIDFGEHEFFNDFLQILNH
jgi:hypothetical protein